MEHATPASERILHIKEKRICLDSSAVLYARPFDEQSLREDFEATGGRRRTAGLSEKPNGTARASCIPGPATRGISCWTLSPSPSPPAATI